MPTVAIKFACTLKAIGVRYVFGVPSGNMTDYTYPDKTRQKNFDSNYGTDLPGNHFNMKTTILVFR